jgi:hypothetical protein
MGRIGETVFGWFPAVPAMSPLFSVPALVEVFWEVEFGLYMGQEEVYPTRKWTG